MSVRIGYACISIPMRETDIYTGRTLTLKTLELKGVAEARRLSLLNIADLGKILEYNESIGIRFFRITSNLFPHMENQRAVALVGESISDMTYAISALAAVGKRARELGHRITAHPGQYAQLGSLTQSVIEQSARDLNMHAQIFQYMGLTPEMGTVMIIHGGGTFGDKIATLTRWAAAFNNLPKSTQQYISLENDDYQYTVHDLLPTCELLHIPLCVDYFHHICLGETEFDIYEHALIARIMNTWKMRGIRPKCHWSNQDPAKRKGAHSACVSDLPAKLLAVCNKYGGDIMLEVKNKDICVLSILDQHFTKTMYDNRIEWALAPNKLITGGDRGKNRGNGNSRYNGNNGNSRYNGNSSNNGNRGNNRYDGNSGDSGNSGNNSSYGKSADMYHITSSVQAAINSLTAKMKETPKQIFTDLFVAAINRPSIEPQMTIDDIDAQITYSPSSLFRPSTHIGQRKLFLTELQFLTDYVPGDQEVICVYAGAAPSHHTGLLSDLFSNVKFILVDPNKFDVYGKTPVILQARGTDPCDYKTAKTLIDKALNCHDNRLFIINTIFTIDIAKALASQVEKSILYFVSDIRTNMEGDFPSTMDILWNSAQQYNWMQIMMPVMSMLKFRHPFYYDVSHEDVVKMSARSPYKEDLEMAKDSGIDFVENAGIRKFMYYDGIINLQAFSPQSSTETRLITDAKTVVDHGPLENFEDKLYYYNNIDRCYSMHVNENANRNIGFDHCNDCAIENRLWMRYVDHVKKYPKLYRGPTNIQEFVVKLSKNTHRSLLRENHGLLFDSERHIKMLIPKMQDYARKTG